MKSRYKEIKEFFSSAIKPPFCVSSNAATDFECSILDFLKQNYQRSFFPHLPLWLRWVCALRGQRGRENGAGGGAGNQSFQVHRLAATVETLTCHISSSQTRHGDELGQHPSSGDLHLDLPLTPPRRHHGSGVRPEAQSQPPPNRSSSHRREGCIGI